jgi:hypothetical protein
MAEPFGVIAGAFGIAMAFSTCVECFEYIQFGRHFGRDFQTSYLELSFARLRLTRWGEAVDIYRDPNLGNPNTSAADLQMASDIFQQILVLFADTEKISKRYGDLTDNSAPPADTGVTQTEKDLEPGLKSIDTTIKSLVRRRQKGTGLMKKTTWALYHASEFRTLITGIATLIGHLETLFPAPAVRSELVKEDLTQFQATDCQLEVVITVAGRVDSQLQAAANQALGGHSYNRMRVTGGTAINGDSIASDWKGNLEGGFHSYNDIEVAGNAKVLNGNKYGGNDIFE